MTSHAVGHLNEFPEGKGIQVDINGIKVAIFNVGGDLYGIQDNCPHKNLPLHPVGQTLPTEEPFCDNCKGGGCEKTLKPGERGIDEESLTVHCPWHSLEWSLETGENPVLKQRIPTYVVTVGDDGTVTVEL